MLSNTPERLIAAAEVGRKCVRCHTDVHASDGPHLCKDLAKRLARQQKAVRHVVAILDQYGLRTYGALTDNAREAAALDIVRKLSGLDLDL